MSREQSTKRLTRARNIVNDKITTRDDGLILRSEWSVNIPGRKQFRDHI